MRDFFDRAKKKRFSKGSPRLAGTDTSSSDPWRDRMLSSDMQLQTYAETPPCGDLRQFDLVDSAKVSCPQFLPGYAATFSLKQPAMFLDINFCLTFYTFLFSTARLFDKGIGKKSAGFL